jgi:hypothetical protein
MHPKPVITRVLACGALALAAVTTACSPDDQSLLVGQIQNQTAVLASMRSQSALSDEQLARLANCESGGNPAARSRNGKYLGLYQFNQGTWNSTAASVLPEYVGVSPAAAPAEVQNAMARALHLARGRSPWPVCGRRL